MPKKEFLIGAHINISNVGPGGAIEIANQIGANTLQIFSKSNRSYYGSLFSDKEVESWMALRKKYEFKTVFVHAGYLINLANAESDVFEKSIQSLVLELQYCHQLQVPYLVLHPGSRKLSSSEEACKQVASGLDMAFARLGKPCKTTVLLESMAGDGSKLSSFAELKAIREASSNKQHIGFCIDTAHAFVFGYQIDQSCHKLVSDAEHILGLENVKMIHLNDSKYECGSKRDEHENWPDGRIGKVGLKNILQSKLGQIPLIVETPHEPNDYSPQAEEIRLIKSLV